MTTETRLEQRLATIEQEQIANKELIIELEEQLSLAKLNTDWLELKATNANRRLTACRLNCNNEEYRDYYPNNDTDYDE